VLPGDEFFCCLDWVLVTIVIIWAIATDWQFVKSAQKLPLLASLYSIAPLVMGGANG